MNKEEIKELGRKSYIVGSYPAIEYKKIFNLDEDSDISNLSYEKYWGDRWTYFLTGWYEELNKYLEKRRKELKVDDFIEEFKALCKKYNVTMCYGGGDADCGFMIEDYNIGMIETDINK